MLFQNLPDMGRYRHIFEVVDVLRYFPEDPIFNDTETESFTFIAKHGFMSLNFTFGSLTVKFEFPLKEAHTRFVVVGETRDQVELARQHFYPSHPSTCDNINRIVVNAFHEHFVEETDVSKITYSSAAVNYHDKCFVPENYHPFKPRVRFFRRRSILGNTFHV